MIGEASAVDISVFLPDNPLVPTHALVEVGDVGVDQPEAVRRRRGRCVGPVCAVNAMTGGAERIARSPSGVSGPSGHEARR